MEEQDHVLNVLVSKSGFLDGLFINLFHHSFFHREYPLKIITNKEDNIERLFFPSSTFEKNNCCSITIIYHLLSIDGNMYSFENSNTYYLSLDYKGRGKAKHWMDLFFGNYPSGLKMKLRSLKDDDTQVEDILVEQKKRRDEHRMINVFTSSILFFVILFFNWTFGWKPLFIISCLLVTSIEYHYWGRHRFLDSIIACISTLYMYSLYITKEARLCLLVGNLFYLLEFLLIQKDLIRFDSLQAIFLHSYCHLFSYLSIFPEYIFRQNLCK